MQPADVCGVVPAAAIVSLARFLFSRGGRWGGLVGRRLLAGTQPLDSIHAHASIYPSKIEQVAAHTTERQQSKHENPTGRPTAHATT